MDGIYNIADKDETKIRGLENYKTRLEQTEEEEAKGTHYTGANGKDTVDELYEEGTEVGHYFCYGNIKKYTKRLGKKGKTLDEKRETMKKDLFKIANYALLILKHEYNIEYELVKK